MNHVTLYRYNAPSVKPAQIIDGILAIVFPDAVTAVDLTPGRGHFWGKSPRVEVTRSEHDFCGLPYVDAKYHVALFDPPHNEDMGSKSVMRQYGTYHGGTLESVIRLGCLEAKRVSALGVVVKVTDQTHGQEFVHESKWVLDVLGKPYEITYGTHAKVRDPKWKLPPCSIYNNGSVYLVYRWGSQKHVRRVKAQVQASV